VIKMKRLVQLSLVALVLCLTTLCSHAETQEQQLVVAEGEGTGTDREEALRMAWQDSVRKATGLVMDATTVRKGADVVDSITLLSRGYIEKYELLDESEKDGLFHTKVKAWIRRDIILQGLLAEKPSEYVMEGRSLYARALTREQQIREAIDILDEWFTAFKYENYLIASVSDPAFRHGAGEVVVKLSLSFDSRRFYSEFCTEVGRLLDYVALAKEADLPMFLPFDARSGLVRLPYERKSVGEYVDLMGLNSARERMPHASVTEAEGGAGRANVYLASSPFYFSAYRLPEEVFNALWVRLWKGVKSRPDGTLFREGNFRIALKSEGGTELLVHEHPLSIDSVILFPDPRSPLMTKGAPGKDQALFLIPGFGKRQPGNQDYKLFPYAETEIVIKVAPDTMRSVAKAACSVVLKR